MNASAEAADQIVRISLNATETALRITGKSAEKMAILLCKILNDMSKEEPNTKGQAAYIKKPPQKGGLMIYNT